MDLTQTTTTYASDDRTWLRSAHGTDEAIEGTIDCDAIIAALPDVSTGDRVPSGTLLGRQTADGALSAYNAGAADGTEAFYGILLSSVVVTAGRTVGCPVMIRGTIVEANLPYAVDAAGGPDAAARTHPEFTFLA